MKIVPTKLDGVFVIETDVFKDDRGIFIKTFNTELFSQFGLQSNFTESFYSVSNKNVIRGMHIQVPPKDHYKLVFVTRGAVLDVVLDIRVGSPTYGEYHTVELSEKNNSMIYMPPGCVHGFLSLEDNSSTVYLQTATYSKEHDTGIHPLSFGLDWGVQNPIMSKRDTEFAKLEDFKSPFMYTPNHNA